jgi:hypothetical protein
MNTKENPHFFEEMLACESQQGGDLLAYWQGWLCDPSVDARKRLLEVIRVGVLPGHLLHHFSCDCLARSLAFAQRRSIPHHAQAYQLVETKRAWIEGRATMGELRELREALQKRGGGVPHTPSARLHWMAISTACEDAATAARYGSQYPLQEDDHRWQCEHLASMVCKLLEARQQFFSLLYWQKILKEGHLQRWQALWEAPLYSSS